MKFNSPAGLGIKQLQDFISMSLITRRVKLMIPKILHQSVLNDSHSLIVYSVGYISRFNYFTYMKVLEINCLFGREDKGVVVVVVAEERSAEG